MATEATVREWGGSLGVIIPRSLVHREDIKPGEKVIIEIRKKAPLKEFFGALKGAKIDSQKMKDESRKMWKMQ